MKLNSDLKKQVEKGISILKNGGLVAYPTDTVYGLGASAYIPQAAKRIYEVKRRPKNMALPLLLAHISQITEVSTSVSPIAWFLAGRFLPGALTLVLLKSLSVSDVITGGSDKVAVRIPAHPVPIALICGLGAPLVGTSANLSGKPSAITTEDVRLQIGSEIDLIIDGGRAPGGIESTVVDVSEENPRILREGAVPREELERACAFFNPKVALL